MNKHITLFLVVVLSGCSSLVSVPPTVEFSNVPAFQVARLASVENTEFDAVATVIGPESSRAVGTTFNYHTEEYFLRSFIDKSSARAISHQLYVVFKYRGDWRFYQGAQMAGGKTLESNSISRDVIYCGGGPGCDLWETVGVSIGIEDFESAITEGMRIRINSQYANINSVFALPPSLFDGQNQVIQRVISNL